MTIAIPSYVEVISLHFPDIQVIAYDDGSDYNSIILLSGNQIPAQDVLDTFRIADIKSIMWRQIQARRDSRKQGGVKVGNYWFHSDEASRIQQIGLVMFGANLPSGIMWKTMSGDFVQMTSTLAQQIFAAVASSDVTVFGVAEYHRANLNASSDPANYDYLTGWPLIFGE